MLKKKINNEVLAHVENLKNMVDTYHNNYTNYYTIIDREDYIRSWYYNLWEAKHKINDRELIESRQIDKFESIANKQLQEVRIKAVNDSIWNEQMKQYNSYLYDTDFGSDTWEIEQLTEDELEELKVKKEYEEMILTRVQNMEDFNNISVTIEDTILQATGVNINKDNIMNYIISKHENNMDGEFDVSDLLLASYYAFRRTLAGKNKVINKNMSANITEEQKKTVTGIYSCLEFFNFNEIFTYENFNIIYMYALTSIEKIKKTDNKLDKKNRLLPYLYNANNPVDVQFRRLCIALSTNSVGEIYHNIRGRKKDNNRNMATESMYTDTFQNNYIKQSLGYSEIENVEQELDLYSTLKQNFEDKHIHVINLLAKGYSYNTIAKELKISKNTIIKIRKKLATLLLLTQADREYSNQI